MAEKLNHNVLRPAQVSSLIPYLMKGKLSFMMTGAPGVGKSDLLRQGCAAAGSDLIVMHPAISDPTKFEGLPFRGPDGTYAEFLPYGELHRILKHGTERPGVSKAQAEEERQRGLMVALEDFGQSTPAVQAACMQLLHSATGERRLGDKVIPSHVTFALTSNRRNDRAGVQGILETIKSRVATIIEVAPTLDDWKGWAMSHDIAPEVVGFLNFREGLFLKFEPTADLTNYPCPRTWAHVSDLVKLGLPGAVRLPTFAGAVGDGAASEFIAFLDVYEEAPNIEDIIADPKHAPIPSIDKPSVLYAVSSALAYKANPKTMGAICTYALRMYKDHKSEFATITIVDSIRRDKKLAKHEAYAAYCLSEAGKHILEARDLQ